MISNFPGPHPDELFYSICARFSDRMQYPNGRSVVKDLFGSVNAIACVSLPSHLDYFAAQALPPRLYNGDNVIDNHTLLPLIAAFLPPERLSRLRADMLIGNGPALHMRAGLMASRVHLPSWLRFCPQCVDEDRQRVGECYWHRLHQAPGVEICPIHRCWLKSSNASTGDMRTRYKFISAERALRQEMPKESNKGMCYFEALLTLAMDIKWLLDARSLSQSLFSLQERYQSALYDLGLSTYRGRVNKDELLARFKEVYPLELLSLLHCELDEHIEDPWLMRLVRKPDNAQHPLHHLLLIGSLGLTAEQFFNILVRSNPFGDGPWPCLNPACRYYCQRQIGECQITYSPYLKGKPTGSFSCVCGFTYTRTGPDMSGEDQFKTSRVQNFGNVWEARLKTLWYDTEFSLHAIARQLRVDTLTVKRHADRLSLTLPRPIRKGGQLKDMQKLRVPTTQAIEPAMLERYRAQWIEAMTMCQEIGLKAVRKKCPGVYAWLYRNDRVWLQTHSPSSKLKSGLQRSSVDWEARDAKLVQMVEISARRLKSLEGRPLQVTISAIGKDIGQLSLLQKHLRKLPMTAQQLKDCIETREKFAVRRIQWAAKQYKGEHLMPKQWEFVKRAGIVRVMALPQVKEALNNALHSLQPLPQ